MSKCAIVAVKGFSTLNNAGVASDMAASSEIQLHHNIFAGLRELYSESCTGVSLFTLRTPSQARSFFALLKAKLSAEVKSFNNGGTHYAYKIHNNKRRIGGNSPETCQRMLQNGSRYQNASRPAQSGYDARILRRSVGRFDSLTGKAVI